MKPYEQYLTTSGAPVAAARDPQQQQQQQPPPQLLQPFPQKKHRVYQPLTSVRWVRATTWYRPGNLNIKQMQHY